MSDKDDSLWYNLGALCYDNGLMELELGNKEIASSHFNNALNKLEHVRSYPWPFPPKLTFFVVTGAFLAQDEGGKHNRQCRGYHGRVWRGHHWAGSDLRS